MNKSVKLSVPEEIVISEDIREPDKYLDLLIAAFGKDKGNVQRLEVIKSLDHSTKVKWLLSQTNKTDTKVTREWVCTTILVTTVVIIIIGYELYQGAMHAITEKQEVEKEVEKCFERPTKP